MEATRAEKIRLGIFAVTIATIFAGFLLYVAGRHLLAETVHYYTYFRESVDGLNPGAKVKLNGVVIGRVDVVKVHPENISYVYVRYQLEKGAPIREGMRAHLVGGLSITGLKSVEISGGADSLPALVEGSEIPVGASQFQKITGQAESIALKFEGVMNNLLAISGRENQDRLSQFLEHVEKISAVLDESLGSNRKTLKKLPATLVASINDFQKTSAEIRLLAEELHKSQPGKRIDRTLGNLESASASVRQQLTDLPMRKSLEAFVSVAGRLESAARRIDLTLMRVNEDLGSSMGYLKETMENMSDFSRQIKENPSLLLRSEEKQERER